MNCRPTLVFASLLLTALVQWSVADESPLSGGNFNWTATGPLIAGDSRHENPAHSFKDPSVVFHEGKWHIYATVRTRDGVHMVYLSFTDWNKAGEAKQQRIKLVDAYHCAPQVLYFRPQKKWYLIYQWGDDTRKYFGPCFSTIDDVSKPQTLTRPVMLYDKKPENLKGWLDFWVICDESKAHLFFTSLDGRMWRAETSLDAFPHGWSEPKVVLQGDIFEASHTYRVKGVDGAGKYLTIIEAQASGGRRYFKAYQSDRLDGQWKPVADSLKKPFGAQANVAFADGVEAWTDSISHGELLRDGFDETMTIDPANLRMLFQGCSAKDRAGKGYGAFPWRLGLLTPAK